VKQSIQLRDELDSRTNALAATEGAVHLDTSELTVEQVVARIVLLAEQAGVVEPRRPAEEGTL
jgi:cytidylate kinase